MKNDPNKKTVAQLADQVVATWPDSWFLPRPIEAMAHVAEIKATYGLGMGLTGDAAEGVEKLLVILGSEAFANDITHILQSARNHVLDQRNALIRERVDAEKLATDQKKREINLTKALAERERREFAEKEAREIREAEEKARHLLLENLRNNIFPKFETDFLGVDAVFRQNTLWVGLEEEYASLKNDFLKNWFNGDGESNGRTLHNLDSEQLQAIGSVDGNFQVVARAGSGKTTVSVYRAYFLIKHCKIRPDQILLLAFNRDAAMEIRRRLLFLFKPDAERLYLSKRRSKLTANGEKGKKSIFDIESEVVGELIEMLGVELPFAMTFHALAYAIDRPEGAILKDDPEAKDRTLSATVQELVDYVLKEPKKASSIRELMMRHFRHDWELLNNQEYGMSSEELLLWRRSLPNQTIDGQYRKSLGEKIISDFLFEHSIEYHYERNVWWGDTNYKPDFTILKPGDRNSGLVIEYFGLDDSTYLKQIDEKRKFWQQKESWELIEVYPKDIAKGFEYLGAIIAPHFKALRIPIKKLTDEQIWALIEDDAILQYTVLLTGFITRCRQIGWDSIKLGQKIGSHPVEKESTEGLFLHQATYMFGMYEKALKEKGDTDFSELISKAARKISNGGTAFYRTSGNGNLGSLRYVFVDEFQDFSFLFDSMIKSIFAVNDQVSLFCVGDNWQAINGFAGSDLHYFENFQESIPNSKRIFLSANYRSDANIVKFGNDIMATMSIFDRNAVASKPSINLPLIGYLDGLVPTAIEMERSENDVITPALLRIINSQLIHDRDVVVLSRTKNIPYYTDAGESGRKVKNLESFLEHIQSFFPEELSKRISISTSHRYKGRERQAVIILDAIQKRYPLIHRDWIFSQIFGITIPTIVDDDRRLFYVAATRAIDQLFIISESRESLTPYVQEFGNGHTVLDWTQFAAPTSKSNLIIVQVTDIKRGSTYAIKEFLNANGFKFSGATKLWQKAFLSEAFSITELELQSWACYNGDNSENRIQVVIHAEPQGEIAKFEVLNGTWITIFSHLELLDNQEALGGDELNLSNGFS